MGMKTLTSLLLLALIAAGCGQAASTTGTSRPANGSTSHSVAPDVPISGPDGSDGRVMSPFRPTWVVPHPGGGPLRPVSPSGLRVGTPAGTTRGFGVAEFRQVGKWMGEVLDAVASGENSSAVEQKVRAEVVAMTRRFPIYS